MHSDHNEIARLLSVKHLAKVFFYTPDFSVVVNHTYYLCARAVLHTILLCIQSIHSNTIEFCRKVL